MLEPAAELERLHSGRMTRMKRISVAVVVLTLAATPRTLAQSGVWTLDTNHSAAYFSARHLLVSNVRGQLGPVTGTVEWDGKTIES